MQSGWLELKHYLERAIEDKSMMAVKNIDRYRGLDGSISAHVMRFEDLNNDFQQFVTSLGTKYPASLPHAKKGLLANRLNPRDLLNKRQLAIINEDFWEEFETFRYEPL